MRRQHRSHDYRQKNDVHEKERFHLFIICVFEISVRWQVPWDTVSVVPWVPQWLVDKYTVNGSKFPKNCRVIVTRFSRARQGAAKLMAWS